MERVHFLAHFLTHSWMKVVGWGVLAQAQAEHHEARLLKRPRLGEQKAVYCFFLSAVEEEAESVGRSQ